jgi:adenosylcobyric acid synthase
MHGGDVRRLINEAGCNPENLLDLSANINPLDPPAGIWADLARAGESITRYPDPECIELRETAARFYECSPDQILAGNGSTELLFATMGALRPRRVLIPAPAYTDYAVAAERSGIAVEWIIQSRHSAFALDLDEIRRKVQPGDLVIIGRPNNPTGHCPDGSALMALAAENPEMTFLIDEAFIDLSDCERIPVAHAPNMLLLRSLTKSFAIPGIRLGVLCGDKRTIEHVAEYIPSWSVNTFAQEVGVRLFSESDYLERSRNFIREERERVSSALSKLKGMEVYPGAANYLLIRVTSARWSGTLLRTKLLEDGIAIRVCGDFEGLDDSYIRIAIRTSAENDRFLVALGSLFGSDKPRARRITPAVMLQGTSSNAGKSVLVAALCRILLQDGLRVAPFKAQNMSLNSFVTRDGLEMGRAQVTQAMAARTEPDVRMNPILLKPSSDTGSQVIVRGKSIGHLKVLDYVEYKRTAWESVRECYDSLASEFDIVVLEGAGSPGEVNLKQHDIVNMRMAEYAQSPVLLVGDIDRGGVFASFVGTWTVLEPWERALLAGFVVNRFRGDASLLGSALSITERYTGKPTYGVVDFLPELGLPEEDSVEFKETASLSRYSDSGDIEIAVIDLPHISNFTDFDALSFEPDVALRIVRPGDVLGNPDLVILPGSKSVAADLVRLRETRHIDGIMDYHRRGGRIVGICGGFQMLGDVIRDPFGVESKDGEIQGIGLLPCRTALEQEKTLKRTQAVQVGTGEIVHGYEIHHGQTEIGDTIPWITNADEAVGVVSRDGRVWGTYLHGLFDADGFRRHFLNELRVAKGLTPIATLTSYNLDVAIDRLADHVRDRLNMDEIYRLVGI